jgi:hypothetical protein
MTSDVGVQNIMIRLRTVLRSLNNLQNLGCLKNALDAGNLIEVVSVAIRTV